MALRREWTDGAFPVLESRGFYSTSGACSVSPFTTIRDNTVLVVAAISSTTAGRSVSGPSTYRGLTQFLVRSMDKVKTIALWHALTHNMVLHVASDAGITQRRGARAPRRS
jgi:hypothetical protein